MNVMVKKPNLAVCWRAVWRVHRWWMKGREWTDPSSFQVLSCNSGLSMCSNTLEEQVASRQERRGCWVPFSYHLLQWTRLSSSNILDFTLRWTTSQTESVFQDVLINILSWGANNSIIFVSAGSSSTTGGSTGEKSNNEHLHFLKEATAPLLLLVSSVSGWTKVKSFYQSRSWVEAPDESSPTEWITRALQYATHNKLTVKMQTTSNKKGTLKKKEPRRGCFLILL